MSHRRCEEGDNMMRIDSLVIFVMAKRFDMNEVCIYVSTILPRWSTIRFMLFWLRCAKVHSRRRVSLWRRHSLYNMNASNNIFYSMLRANYKSDEKHCSAWWIERKNDCGDKLEWIVVPSHILYNIIYKHQPQQGNGVGAIDGLAAALVMKHIYSIA